MGPLELPHNAKFKRRAASDRPLEPVVSHFLPFDGKSP